MISDRNRASTETLMVRNLTPRLRHSTGQRKRFLLLATAGLSLVAAVGCGTSSGKDAQRQMPPALVTVANVTSQNVPIYAEFAAQTYARNMVEVRARVDGFIEKWSFKPGAEVKAGQVLYTLDTRPYQAAVEQARGNVAQSEADLEFAKKQVSLLQAQANLSAAEANLIKARQDFERLQPLVKQDAAPQQDLDAAVASLTASEENVKAQKAAVEQTKLQTQTQIQGAEGKLEALKGALRTTTLNLQYGTVTAPISGRIGDSLVPVGGLVTAASAQPLTTIVPLDPIWVRFKVTETQYLEFAKRGHKLADELPVDLILADGSKHTGRVENSLNQVDPKTGTLELQAEIPNPAHTILPGQFGQVRLQVEDRQNAILIPQKAVQQLQSMQMVYALTADNKVQAQPITTGDRSGDMWIVSKGLKAGDRVVVDGQMRVRPGMTVNPQPYESGKTGSTPGGLE